MLTEKAYDATIRLGAATTTDDAEGEVVSTHPVDGVREDDVRRELARLVGDIEQVPTAVSAIKVDGKRAYARVRDGEQVELKARPVTIHELVVHDVVPAPEHVDVSISVRCSSGTYIRAIARDVGAALGWAATWWRCGVRPWGPSTSRSRARSTSSRTGSPSCRSRTPRARPSPRSTSTTRRLRTYASAAPCGSRCPARSPRGVRPGRRVPRALRAARRPGQAARGLRLTTSSTSPRVGTGLDHLRIPLWEAVSGSEPVGGPRGRRVRP